MKPRPLAEGGTDSYGGTFTSNTMTLNEASDNTAGVAQLTRQG
jgi:hypothetical protein